MGRSIAWISLLLVFVGGYDVAMRYVFNAPPEWAYQTLTFLGGSMYILGWSYVSCKRAHIRVDVLYERFPVRARAIIDSMGHLFLFYPLLGALIFASFKWMMRAWRTNEVMAETNWYIPAGPFRTIVFVAFCLFAIQGLADLVRDLHIVLKGEPINEQS
jgi:TRAP-type mannitol/chloroaromatic compound transport system permease small subunit